MLTLKSIDHNGDERVFPASDIRFFKSLGVVRFVCSDIGTEQEISDGRVFVMNEAGGTIASYDLRVSHGRSRS